MLIQICIELQRYPTLLRTHSTTISTFAYEKYDYTCSLNHIPTNDTGETTVVNLTNLFRQNILG
jgi:hypothetical protein